MSEAVTPDRHLITLSRIDDIGLLSLRGSRAVVSAALQKVGLAAPDQRKITCAAPKGSGLPREIGAGGGSYACWMSPDEILLVVPLQALAQLQADLSSALLGQHHLLVDITDGRCVFGLRGAGLREVLAKAMPVDLDPAVFGVNEIRRTRAGQINVAFWLTAEDAGVILSARSVGTYLETLLRTLAKPGSEVGLFS